MLNGIIAKVDGDGQKFYVCGIYSDGRLSHFGVSDAYGRQVFREVRADDSPLVDYAKRELAIAGWEQKDGMYDGVLGAIKEFCRGHSGGSAPFAIAAINKLLKFEPLIALTALTGADDEWIEVDDEGLMQNRRLSSVFKGPRFGGHPYMQGRIVYVSSRTDNDGLFLNGHTYTSGYSSTPIKFPFLSAHLPVVYIPVDAEGVILYEGEDRPAYLDDTQEIGNDPAAMLKRYLYGMRLTQKAEIERLEEMFDRILQDKS